MRTVSKLVHAALLALLAAITAPALAVGPCLPPGVTGFKANDGSVKATAWAAVQDAYYQRFSNSTMQNLAYTTYNCSIGSPAQCGWSVRYTDNSGGSVTFWPPIFATAAIPDPGALGVPPFQCTTTPAEEACAAQSPYFTSSGLFTGTSTASATWCHDGCGFAPKGVDGMFMSKDSGTSPTNWTFIGTLAPTGGTCTTSTAKSSTDGTPDADKCMPHGANLSTCWNASTRQICTTTPRGAKACWTPTDTKTFIAPDYLESLAKATAPTVPTAPTGLVNAETDQVRNVSQTDEGRPPTSTVYNITYANQRGNANTATDGSGSGDGSGDGECSGVGSDCTGAGNAGTGLTGADIYGGNGGKTFASVYATFKADIADTEIVTAADNALTVTPPAGSCPIFTAGPWEPWMPETFTFDAHCSGTFSAVLTAAGYLLLVGGLFMAIRVALL